MVVSHLRSCTRRSSVCVRGGVYACSCPVPYERAEYVCKLGFLKVCFKWTHESREASREPVTSASIQHRVRRRDVRAARLRAKTPSAPSAKIRWI